ncbi:glycosyltransferase [Poritiphilus flavus]|uniref:Glycosyltransferase n=1 Tax=Poritiphilus flavus TaxID=2697053 RepID=A0A6L9E9T9_9FLAO|nr:glycosyltransferase [Poritiphilus flavus]NAS11515.1 glycosyltransferase [Poritiphilus flavus]
MSIVLFDPDYSGHHSEYISHLVDFLTENDLQTTYHLVVPPDFKSQFTDITRKSEGSENIHWHYLKEEEIESLENLSMMKRSFVEYRLMCKYAEQLRATTVHLLYFNTFQLALAFKRPNFSIRGILFQQYTRMPKNGLKNRLKYYRKWLTTKAYCLNPRIERVYILNDSKTVDVLNKKFDTSIFAVLPDPVPIIEPLEGFDIYGYYNIPSHKKIILHFGTLANRKGSFEIVDSLQYLNGEHRKGLTILMVGKPEDESTKNLLEQKISTQTNEDSSLVIMDSKFVSNAQMKSLFNQCYAVLMPYKNPEASSGILGHAIASKKPVIITGEGLLKELVEESGNGLFLDRITPRQIAKGIEGIDSIGKENSDNEKYLSDHTPYEFAKTVLN